MKHKKLLFIFLFILFAGCALNGGRYADGPPFFITDIEFEDISETIVDVVFVLHNNVNKTGICSVKAELYNDDKRINSSTYKIGELEPFEERKERISVNMPFGKTLVNVTPLCKVKKEFETDGFMIDNIRMPSHDSVEFELFNQIDFRLNCSAKLMLSKEDEILSQEFFPIGVVNPGEAIKHKLPIRLPSGNATVDVLPFCNPVE